MLLQKLFDLFFGGDEEVATESQKLAGGASAVAAESDAAITLLMTRLAGDDDGALSQRIFNALSQHRGVQVKMLEKSPLPTPLDKGFANLTNGIQKCWSWMDQQEADVVVWGDVADGVVKVRFVPHDTGGDGLEAALSFADTFIAPAQVNDGHCDVIYACALMALMPKTREQAALRNQLGSSAVSAFENILRQQGGGLNEQQIANAQVLYGAIKVYNARVKGHTANLGTVVESLQAATKLIGKDKHPIEWSLARAHLADAHYAMSERSTDIEAMENTIKAYKVAAEGVSLKALPHEWAEAKIRLGRTLHRLAIAKPDMSHLKEAVGAYKSSLTVFTKANFPERWADINNYVGQAFAAFGESAANSNILKEAAELYKKVLEVRTREKNPLTWAATQNNLGAVLFAIAKYKNDVGLLKEAKYAFNEALGVYQEVNHAKMVHVTSNNMNRVDRLVASWERQAEARAKAAADNK